MTKFKVGDVVIRLTTRRLYKILGVVGFTEYIIELPNGTPHHIEKRYVDKECRLATKLEQALL